jgi:hypothetical protein
MSDTPEYTPPKVWTWNKPNGGKFASINRPISGPTHDKELPVGRHPWPRRTARKSRSCWRSCWHWATRARNTTPG